MTKNTLALHSSGMSQNDPQRPKYGLYVPPKKTNLAPVKQTSIFGDDNEETVSTHRKPDAGSGGKQMENPFSQAKKRELEKLQQDALAEDPNAFLYDEVVHAPVKVKPASGRSLNEDAKKPKYMENLLRMAEERKALNEVTRVRMAKKEAALEEEKFKDKEVFVTSGYVIKFSEISNIEFRYKKKLEEMKDRLQEESCKDEEDVTRQKDMSAFYSNLLKGNVAYGAGKGGRIREQQLSSRTEPIKRLGSSRTAASQNLPEELEEEEHFGPVRRK
jgi:hypothetical protein